MNYTSSSLGPGFTDTVDKLTSSRIKSATVNDIIETNRIIKFVKTTPNFISIPRLNINSLKIVAFSDASYNNLGDGGSQGAHIIFLADDENNCSPMYWASNRIDRVVKSTLGAEKLALVDGSDTAYFISKLLSEIMINIPGCILALLSYPLG